MKRLVIADANERYEHDVYEMWRDLDQLMQEIIKQELSYLGKQTTDDYHSKVKNTSNYQKATEMLKDVAGYLAAAMDEVEDEYENK